MPTLPSVGSKVKKNSNDDFEMMPSIKKVMDYGHLSFYQALDLPCDVFKLMLKHATVEQLMQTEEGRKQLEDIERLKTSSIDLDGLITNFSPELNKEVM